MAFKVFGYMIKHSFECLTISLPESIMETCSVVLTFECFTLSLPESIMETCSVVLTFESVDIILWCDHSNENSSVVALHGTI